MSDDDDLIRPLADAQRASTHGVDALRYATLDRPAAYRIQHGVRLALGADVGMLKTAVHSDGVGVVAPIYASRVGYAPDFQLPVGNVIGLEVEVGLVLGADVTGANDASAAIDHYFLGAEICGSRYLDRSLAGPIGGLADNMSALGYAIGARRALGSDIDGLTVALDFAGRRIFDAPAKHGFGSVLASFLAYADNQLPDYPLKAGTIITTGSLCGLVATTGTGHVVARLGDDTLEFDIV